MNLFSTDLNLVVAFNNNSREIQKGGHGKFNYGKEGEEVNAYVITQYELFFFKTF